MTHDELDLLIAAAAHDLANPAEPNDFATRLKQRSLTMNMTPATPNGNLLLFTTVDRTRGSRDHRTFAGAVLLHAAAALLLVSFGLRATQKIVLSEPLSTVSLVAPPPPLPPKAILAGGGGGQQGPTPVTRGNPPKFSAEQLNPPKLKVDQPKLAVEPTVDVQKDLKMAKVDSPNFGMPNAPAVGMSMGNGHGVGIGAGNGNGIGPGIGGNYGGGLRHIGGGVSAPVVLFQPEPEFSEEARKAKVAGNVLVYLQVDTNGNPTHIHVVRGIGMGLDEKAMEAVHKYKFKPALEDGRPVPVEMQIEVNFQIF
jgi:protein TonB